MGAYRRCEDSSHRRRSAVLSSMWATVPASGNREGDKDDARTTAADSKTWSATWLSSYGIRERWLEAATARVSMRRVQRCKISNDLVHQGLRQRKGRIMVEERGRGEASLHRNRRGFGRCPAEFR
jgi:hypothetical protein